MDTNNWEPLMANHSSCLSMFLSELNALQDFTTTGFEAKNKFKEGTRKTLPTLAAESFRWKHLPSAMLLELWISMRPFSNKTQNSGFFTDNHQCRAYVFHFNRSIFLFGPIQADLGKRFYLLCIALNNLSIGREHKLITL